MKRKPKKITQENKQTKKQKSKQKWYQLQKQTEGDTLRTQPIFSNDFS